MITVERTIVDPIGENQFNRLRAQVEKVMNATTTLRRLGGFDTSPDPRRDIDDECGYLKTEQITLEHYHNFYDRNAIAKKVVELLPKHCWQVHPIISEGGEDDDDTEFEIALKELGNKLRGESFFQDDKGDPFWEFLSRVDILSGIGHYGALLIGVGGAEGKDLAKPISLTGKIQRDLIFLRVFPERLATVDSFDEDSSSPRFGLPETYSMSFDDISTLEIASESSVRPKMEVLKVHWSRVIHIVDQVMSNEVFGIPRMRPVFNNLQNLYSLYGSSTEMYYKGALPGYSFETHPSLGGDVEVDTSSLKSEAENWINGLQRMIQTVGMHVNSLAPQVVDPSPQIDVNIEAICVEQDCPKRVFLGSERGELASSQDRNHWDDVVQARRDNHVTPKIIVPTINRLILMGVLPTPEGFSAKWPEIETMSPLEKADIAIKMTQAIVAFIAGSGEQLIPVISFLTLVLGFSQEEAIPIIEVIEEENRQMILPEVEEPEDEGEEGNGPAATAKKAEGDMS